jgi:hypothetical protein
MEGAKEELLARVMEMDDSDAYLALADLENSEQVRQALEGLLGILERREIRSGRVPRDKTELFIARQILEWAKEGRRPCSPRKT